jgi:hypothetical protein
LVSLPGNRGAEAAPVDAVRGPNRRMHLDPVPQSVRENARRNPEEGTRLATYKVATSQLTGLFLWTLRAGVQFGRHDDDASSS